MLNELRRNLIYVAEELEKGLGDGRAVHISDINMDFESEIMTIVVNGTAVKVAADGPVDIDEVEESFRGAYAESRNIKLVNLQYIARETERVLHNMGYDCSVDDIYLYQEDKNVDIMVDFEYTADGEECFIEVGTPLNTEDLHLIIKSIVFNFIRETEK